MADDTRRRVRSMATFNHIDAVVFAGYKHPTCIHWKFFIIQAVHVESR